MAKILKIWNGRGHGKYTRGHIYVAAYTKKQAAELVSRVCYNGRIDIIRPSEITTYYSEGAWGNTMDGIIPTEPCVYITENFIDKNPKRII